MVEAALACNLDLLEDGEGADAALAGGGIVEGVHGGKPGLAEIGDGNAKQAAVLAKLDEAGRAPVRVQEARAILGLCIVHAAVGMAPSQVLAIELVALLAVARRNHLDSEILIAPQAASLAAVGSEIRHRNATGDAGAAGLATRYVDMVAGTPVTARQGHFVELFELR